MDPEVVLSALVEGIFPWPCHLSDAIEPDDEDVEIIVEEYERSLVDDVTNSNDEEFARETTRVNLSPRAAQARWDNCDYRSLPVLDGKDLILSWWSPDPRANFELDSARPTRRLQRTMRSGKFVVTFDKAFHEVLLACALVGDRLDSAWITQEIYAAYSALFELGYAHSVECWRREAESFDSNDVRRNLLVGGVYGTAVNGFFEGESMFSVERDASKVALFSLFERLRQNGFALFDAQVLNPHTQSLGGIEIPRYEYLLRLRDATSKRATF